ncbi:O-acetyl-ADP-ribose deacetylase [Oleomonas cavernae]|uniref:O-acetyl-ADP-ribose deacetylase n=2 Tax=Oleomonas cavernae TaxID=2320859 RepID=A0A418WBL2_9PROT|nr:O-acetyl-ADP-ribose deacetylase [Oleomonas cavernae]
MSVADRIELRRGDITKLVVDAIVNAANSSLLGGGGVDGAIHRAAGPGLALECRMLNGCKTGQAKITGGHKLQVKHVIHTVGPVWNGGNHGEPALLAACYANSFRLAAEHGLRTIAFPAISCGIYRYPIEQATEIAMAETLKFLSVNDLPEKVTFVAFSDEIFQAYSTRLPA